MTSNDYEQPTTNVHICFFGVPWLLARTSTSFLHVVHKKGLILTPQRFFGYTVPYPGFLYLLFPVSNSGPSG